MKKGNNAILWCNLYGGAAEITSTTTVTTQTVTTTVTDPFLICKCRCRIKVTYVIILCRRGYTCYIHLWNCSKRRLLR